MPIVRISIEPVSIFFWAELDGFLLGLAPISTKPRPASKEIRDESAPQSTNSGLESTAFGLMLTDDDQIRANSHRRRLALAQNRTAFSMPPEFRNGDDSATLIGQYLSCRPSTADSTPQDIPHQLVPTLDQPPKCDRVRARLILTSLAAFGDNLLRGPLVVSFHCMVSLVRAVLDCTATIGPRSMTVQAELHD